MAITTYTGTSPNKAIQTVGDFANNVYATNKFYTLEDAVEKFPEQLNALLTNFNVKTPAINETTTPAFDVGVTYSIGDAVDHSGSRYFSKVNNNLGNTPPSAEWQIADITISNDSALVSYDNTGTNLTATNLQEVCDELIDFTGGSEDFVASGALGNGDVVTLNADGTVSVVEAQGSLEVGRTVFNSGSTLAIKSIYDSTNDKVVIIYRDYGNSEYGTAIVGTVSGDTISFGTEVVFNSATSSEMDISFDSIGGIVCISYRDGGNLNYGTAIVGTVSGDTISFGTAVVFESSATTYTSCVYEGGSGNTVISYEDSVSDGRSIVGVITGNAIAFGTSVVFETSNTSYISSAVDTLENRVVIAYNKADTSGNTIVGAVSGNVISFGTSVQFDTGSVRAKVAIYDVSQDRIIIAYNKYESSTYYARVIVGNVTETSISFGGAAVTFSSSNIDDIGGYYSSLLSECVISYRDVTDTKGKMVTVATSGFVPTVSTITVFNSSSTFRTTVSDSLNGKSIVSFNDSGNSNYGTSSVIDLNYSTNRDWIGITQQSALDTETVPVTVIGGVSSNQSALTTNTNYFVDVDGTLTTTDTGYKLGKSLSATEIIITGEL